VRVVICVPTTANPEKVEAIRGFGAEVVEYGQDYSEAVARAAELAKEQSLTLVHSTDCPAVLAGAGTITLEMLEQQPALDALVVSLGGGSQAVGAMTVLRGLGRKIPVYAVQARGAPVIHDSFHARRPLAATSVNTIADGLATRTTYALTFDALLAGLEDFLVVSEAEIAEAVRTLIATTHNLVEPSGAVPLAGLLHLRDRLAGRTVGIVVSGANIDQAVLRRILRSRADSPHRDGSPTRAPPDRPHPVHGLRALHVLTGRARQLRGRYRHSRPVARLGRPAATPSLVLRRSCTSVRQRGQSQFGRV